MFDQTSSEKSKLTDWKPEQLVDESEMKISRALVKPEMKFKKSSLSKEAGVTDFLLSVPCGMAVCVIAMVPLDNWTW